MDGNTVFALVFAGFIVFGPLVMAFLEYGLDPIAEKIVDHINKQNEKEES